MASDSGKYIDAECVNSEETPTKTSIKKVPLEKRTKAELIEIINAMSCQINENKTKNETILDHELGRTSTPYINEVKPQQVNTKNLKIPAFNGLNKHLRARDWIRSYQALAEELSWSREMMLTRLFAYLEGYAISWYFDCVQGQITNWNLLKVAFVKRFGHTDKVTYEEIHSLRWDIKHEELASYFERALTMLNSANIDNQLQLEILTKGLPRDYRERMLHKDIFDTSEWFETVRKIQAFRETNYQYDLRRQQGMNRQQTREQVNNLADREDLNKLASRPPREREIVKSDNNESREKCLYCGKNNHRTNSCYFNPRNRNNRAKRSIKLVNAVIDDSQTEVTLDDKLEDDQSTEIDDLSYNQLQQTSEEASGDNKYALMRINDKITVRGLVDSGASRSAIDEDICRKYSIKIIDKTRTLSHVLDKFTTSGIALLSIQIGSRLHQVEADVMPLKSERFIMGTREFNKFGFSLQGEGLITRQSAKSVISSAVINSIDDINTKKYLIVEDHELERLLSNNKDLFSSHDFDVGSNDILSCYIHLKPDAKPHSVPPRRLSLKLQEEEAKQINTLLEHKLIQKSFSCWAAGITFACKEGKAPRLCGDYRVLNSVTIPDKYPIPRIDYIVMNLKGAKIYSKLDLTRGYNNIKIAEEDRYKTAFITNRGLFEWIRMPFGLKNAPAIFQRYMEVVISKCSAFSRVYFDDILVFSDTREDHIVHLSKIFKVLQEYRVKLKRSKCIFMTESICFCGYVINNGSIRRDQSFIAAIDKIERPTSVKDLYKFMGLANYGRNFVRNFAQIAKPLNMLRKKGTEYIWKREHEDCFVRLKEILKSAPSLYLFDSRLRTVLYTDASNYTIGAVLIQVRSVSDEGETKCREVPIGYYSKTLDDTQVKYSIYSKEFLALVKGIGFFKEYLHGAKFTVITDNSALSYFKSSKEVLDKHTRWLMFIEEFDFDIIHKPSSQNKAADALSRLTQAQDILANMDDVIPTRELVKTVVNNVDKRNNPPMMIALADVDRVIKYFHKSLYNHIGYNKLLPIIKKYCVFSDMKERVRKYLLSCEACKLVNQSNQAVGLFKPLPPPTEVNERWHLDFIQGLPPCGDITSILVIIDHVSRFAQAYPIDTLSTERVLEVLEKAFTTHGQPKHIVTDSASCFANYSFGAQMEKRSIVHTMTPPHHHSSNGLVERLNKTLQEALTKYIHETQRTWIDLLPGIVNRYNKTEHRVTKAKPIDLLNRAKQPENAIKHTRDQQRYDAERLNKNRRPGNFQVSDLVFLKIPDSQQRKLKVRRIGPLRIKRFVSPEIVELVKPGDQVLKTRDDHPRVHISDIVLFVPKDFKRHVDQPRPSCLFNN